jgi:hypothetical protein
VDEVVLTGIDESSLTELVWFIYTGLLPIQPPLPLPFRAGNRVNDGGGAHSLEVDCQKIDEVNTQSCLAHLLVDHRDSAGTVERSNNRRDDCEGENEAAGSGTNGKNEAEDKDEAEAEDKDEAEAEDCDTRLLRLLWLADEYLMPRLVALLQHRLLRALSAENALLFFMAAQSLGLTQLSTAAAVCALSSCSVYRHTSSNSDRTGPSSLRAAGATTASPAFAGKSPSALFEEQANHDGQSALGLDFEGAMALLNALIAN